MNKGSRKCVVQFFPNQTVFETTVPPVPTFYQNSTCDVNKLTSMKTSESDVSKKDHSHVSIANTESANSKGKELVYALDSSDEECELVNDDKIRMTGKYHLGESSNSYKSFHSEL